MSKKVTFVHIAKTGGTTINKVFEQEFGMQKSLKHCHHQWDGLNPKDYNFLSGHLKYSVMREKLGDNWNYIAFVRDPFEHLFSHLLSDKKDAIQVYRHYLLPFFSLDL